MDTLLFLYEVRAIAHNRLEFATDPYDQERYQRLLELVSVSYSEILDLPPTTIRNQLRSEFGRITPKVGANAAIFDPQGRIVLMQRGRSMSSLFLPHDCFCRIINCFWIQHKINYRIYSPVSVEIKNLLRGLGDWGIFSKILSPHPSIPST